MLRSITVMLTKLDFQQEEGLMCCHFLLGLNQVEIQRTLTTSVPRQYSFRLLLRNCSRMAKKLCTAGMNALSNNLIMVDRKLLKESERA